MPRKERIKATQKQQAATWEERYIALGDPPADTLKLRLWAARLGALLVREASVDFVTTDTGRERRRHAMQLLRWFADCLEGAELTERITELEEVLANLHKEAGKPLPRFGENADA
jgi:hypothetical protein